MLFNLVDNALKYSSDSAERRVTVRCERQVKGVCIRVADQGPGVDPEHLRKIWQPFFRGERELTRKHKGIAIGNGFVFSMILLLPFIGVIIAPILSVVAATLAVLEVKKEALQAQHLPKQGMIQ